MPPNLLLQTKCLVTRFHPFLHKSLCLSLLTAAVLAATGKVVLSAPGRNSLSIIAIGTDPLAPRG